MECGPVAFGGVLSNGARQFRIGGVRSAKAENAWRFVCVCTGAPVETLAGRIYAMTPLAVNGKVWWRCCFYMPKADIVVTAEECAVRV